MNDVGEITILEEGDVKITNRRAVIGTETYAVSDITSVRMTKAGSSMVGCVTVALISGGLLLGLFSFVSSLYSAQICLSGFILLGCALVLTLTAQPNYIIQISHTSGEAELIQSLDKDYLKRIVDAINAALSYEMPDDKVKMATQS